MDQNLKTGLKSRRGFLKLTSLLLMIYPMKLFFDVLKSSPITHIDEVQQFLPMDLPEGITFHNGIIVNKSGTGIHFFSAVCPHLGCQINRVDRGQLICPCHGSRFSEDGKLLEGPATRSLSELRFSTDTSNNRYIVTLPT
ncbi:Rieske 2Fe-2S domain-containing protein [bacterium]|nr:Rieske 2Fe-2S domain-containing protein [bacterium]